MPRWLRLGWSITALNVWRSLQTSSKGLNRNTAAVAGGVLLMTLGEELWKRFLPKYLEQLGAPLAAIGAYGSVRDLLDGVLQYPGGWIADRRGRRAALRLFIGLAVSGYLLLAHGRWWEEAFAGVALAMAWSSMASPTFFAVIGDALPPERRAIGFSVQSILRRVPIAIAPVIGGLIISRNGIVEGVRWGLGVTIGLSLLTLALVSQVRIPARPLDRVTIGGVWRALPTPLRRLLVSDILIRTCESLVDVLLVIYALDVVGIGAPAYGVLIAVQMTTSILSYFPAARLADRIGRKPLVLATFLAFAAFPLAVVMSRSFAGLVGAFVIGGLRELGEPARKALIVDLAPEALRARAIGLYYLLRSLSIAPAGLVGAALWRAGTALPFLTAGAVGLAGTVTYGLTATDQGSQAKPAADRGRNG